MRALCENAMERTSTVDFAELLEYGRYVQKHHREFPSPPCSPGFRFMYTAFGSKLLARSSVFLSPSTGIMRLETRSEDCRTLNPDMSMYCCSGPCACYQILGEPEWTVSSASVVMEQAKPYRCDNAAFACFISTTFPPHSASQVRLVLDVFGFEFGHLLCIVAHHNSLFRVMTPACTNFKIVHFSSPFMG